MKKQRLLQLATFFALFTFVGHSLGFIRNRVAEAGLGVTYAMMKQTMVNFPMRFSQSVADLMIGANLCLSVYLLISGLIFLNYCGKNADILTNRNILYLNSAGLAFVAAISGVYFFPLPAICLGLSALCGILAVQSSQS